MTEETADFLPFPAYSKEDFIRTDAPYEFVYQYIDNPFELRRMKEWLTQYAKDIGFKQFGGMWNAYLATKKKEGAAKNLKVDNVTSFDGQPFELFSGAYECDDYGVTLQGAITEIVVCPHPIMPIQRLINIDSGEERLKIAYRKGYSWRNIIVEKDTLASSTSILSLAKRGVVVNSENAKALSTYLLDIEQRNYEEIPEVQSVSRLGWIDGHGFAPYVDGLTYDGEENFRHIFNAVNCCGDYEVWKDMAKKVRAESLEGRLTLAASFASVLLKPCGLLPFFLHLWGTTEHGKTVSLMLAASVWANPAQGEYITTFNSTAVGQEMTASFLNNLPMCIDELQIKSSDGVKDFDKMIYQLTEGAGKTRGKRSGGLQAQSTWLNCFITSGEQPITNTHSNGGVVNRIIEVEYQNQIYSDLVTLAETVKQNYGFAGREFVEYLQGDGVLEQVKRLQKSYYRQLIDSESTDKQAASMSAILTADKIVTELIFKDGHYLTLDEAKKILTKKSDVDPNKRAYDFVLELIESHPMNFVKNTSEIKGELWGICELDGTYIIKHIFDREMRSAGFNSQAFLSWAKRNGKTLCEKDRTVKKKRLFNGEKGIWCVCIKSDFVPGIEDDDLCF